MSTGQTAMKKTIYIHVGAGKTGTSAIQWVLLHNRELLSDLGLYVPTVGAEPEKDYLAHHHLTGASRFSHITPWPLWDEIANIDRNSVVVSSEIFHSQISYSGGPAFFEEVKRKLAGWEIKVVFYVRRQDQWIQSAYEQWIKVGALRSGERLEDVIQRYDRDLVSQIDEFASVFGRNAMIVRPYEKTQLVGGDAVHDFFSIFGIEIDGRFALPEKNVNPGIPGAALNIKRIFNYVSDNRSQAQLINPELKAFAKFKEQDDYGQSGKERSLLTQAQRDQINELLRHDYERIARDYLGRSDGRLFSDENPLIATGEPRARSEMPFDMTEGDMEVIMFLMRRMMQRLQRAEKRIKELERAGINSASRG